MASLLHEYWAEEDGGMFGAVREHNDGVRLKMMLGAQLIHSFMACSWFEAEKIHYELQGFGEFIPPEGETDVVYTEDEQVEQQAYLNRRQL
ncbi:MAG: hypothetical protein M3Q19_06015 [Pseudomonadota bacterium]|nr:hypothetical protein [Pseudomonadota bacterium]